MSKAIVTLLLCAGIAAAQSSDPDEGKYYTYRDLGVKKLVVDGTKIHVTFDPVQEQFHWCPGIKVQETKKATVVTFVRCKTSKSCDIDTKAKIGRKLIRTVTINIRGKDVFVRNGPKKYKRVHRIEKKKAPSKAKSATPYAAGWRQNDFATPTR